MNDTLEHFSYSRTWDEIEVMLERAEKLMHYHEVMCIDGSLAKKKRMVHARNFKALQVGENGGSE